MGSYRMAYFVIGTIFFCLFTFFIFVGIMANSEPLPQTYMLFAMTVMAFCMGYLYPQIKQKDERMKLIRQKALIYSFAALVVYYIALTGIIQFDILVLSAMQVLNILGALTISTVFISWVIASKFY